MTQPNRGAIAAFRDDYLMAQISAGSIEAFCELYDRHCDPALGVATSICGDRATAVQTVRDVFLTLWSDRQEGRQYAGTVAEVLLAMVRQRADQIGVTGSPDAEQAVARAEARRTEGRRIGALLDVLPYAQRQVITLAFYGGLTHTEIAEQLDLPTETVRGRMRLGLEQLIAENEHTVA